MFECVCVCVYVCFCMLLNITMWLCVELTLQQIGYVFICSLCVFVCDCAGVCVCVMASV